MERTKVVLKRSYKGNVTGETAWFPNAEAEKMVEMGIAEKCLASAIDEPAPSSTEDPEAAAVAALLKDGPKRTNYKNRQITSEG